MIIENKEFKYRDIDERTFDFAVRVIKAANALPPCAASFEIGKQVISSSCSTNSNIIHARASLTKKEFIYFMNNAKKEAKETKRWLELIVASGLMSRFRLSLLLEEIEEIIKILVTIVKNAEGK